MSPCWAGRDVLGNALTARSHIHVDISSALFLELFLSCFLPLLPVSMFSVACFLDPSQITAAALISFSNSFCLHVASQGDPAPPLALHLFLQGWRINMSSMNDPPKPGICYGYEQSRGA